MSVPGGRRAGEDALVLADLLHHASRWLRRGTAAELAPLGLTVAQARVLRVVGASDRPLCMTEIAAALDMVPRSATTMVDALEAAGLVLRQAAATDRRSVLVTATDRGAELLDQLDRARLTTAEQFFGRLRPNERATLQRLLAKVCDHSGCTSHTASTTGTAARRTAHPHSERLPGPSRRRTPPPDDGRSA